MLLERLLANLAVTVESFAVCVVSSGWRLRMDGLPWVTLHFVLHGEGLLRSRGRRPQRIGPSTLAIVPPRLPHSIESGTRVAHETSTRDSSEGHDGLLEFVAGSGAGRDLEVACGRIQVAYAGSLGLFDLLRESIVLDFSASEEMRSAFERLLDEQRSLSPGSEAMMTAVMTECLVLVFRRLGLSPDCSLPWLVALDDPRLARVLDDVLEHPERPHSVDSLAARAFMSRSSFAQRFAATFERTPMAFVRDVRLRHGAQLLRETDLPVDAVGRRVGFASRSQFSRAFRDYFGRTPARFRDESPLRA